ncbi:hypothetical protein H6F46_12020 [Limnothrix sp. FACHB-1083]|uniref:hypothetical protein n=1 Tax=unclassified Limnothrix TaxID=2632864 RepID=UPI00168113EF|nr:MULTISPECIES: hypothetical protein [unclassified Limnothrix]MBD2161417.1 hypothetical protein [Limnothrix sp. FACHB-1083]MBD2192072.1 hypothetical protein [Limnothrix sp. FACHB-1088]
MNPWIGCTIAFVAGAGLAGIGQSGSRPVNPAPVASPPPEIQIWQSVTPGLSLDDAEFRIGVKGGGDQRSTEPGPTGEIKVLNRAYPIGGGTVLAVRYELAPGSGDYRVDNKMLALKVD